MICSFTKKLFRIILSYATAQIKTYSFALAGK